MQSLTLILIFDPSVSVCVFVHYTQNIFLHFIYAE